MWQWLRSLSATGHDQIGKQLEWVSDLKGIRMKDIGNGAELSGSSSFNRSRSNSIMLVAVSVAIMVMVEEVVVVIVVVLEEVEVEIY